MDIHGAVSIRVHNVYRVTTCRPGRGHIMAASHLHLVCLYYVGMAGDARVSSRRRSYTRSRGEYYVISRRQSSLSGTAVENARGAYSVSPGWQ